MTEPDATPSPEEKRRRLAGLLGQLGGRGLVRGSQLASAPRRKPPEPPGVATAEETKTTQAAHDGSGAGGTNRAAKALEPRETFAPRPPDAAGRVAFDRLFPAAERLNPGEESAAWRLRTVLGLDGSPAPGGLCLPGDPAVLAALDPALAGVLGRAIDLAGVRRERVAFLDIETTGLSGGTGCFAFLVGLGAFEGGAFVVEQYFMDDFPAEPAMLEALASRLAEFAALVTFNGRSFDVPFLRARYMLHRQAAPLHLPNLDLLHPARRIWRARVGGASLGALERAVLGLERVDDVPGALIPPIYLDYVRGVAVQRMVPVVRHNAQDIASMPALFALLCHALTEPEAPAWRHTATQVGLAAMLRRAGRADDALARLESAVLLSRDSDEEHALSMHVAAMHRRRGRTAEAVAIWLARAESAAVGVQRAEACLALARHHEHVAKDVAEATRWALRALEVLGEPAERLARLRAAIAGMTVGNAESSPGETDAEGVASEWIPNSGPPTLADHLIGDAHKRLARLRRKSAKGARSTIARSRLF